MTPDEAIRLSRVVKLLQLGVNAIASSLEQEELTDDQLDTLIEALHAADNTVLLMRADRETAKI